jgi:hypothetical protein
MDASTSFGIRIFLCLTRSKSEQQRFPFKFCSYCEEALQLASYVQRLEKKHGRVPIIRDIVGNVQKSQRLLVKQLLAQIGSPTQLPQCLKLLGYLRRLEVFSPAQLRVKFLQVRYFVYLLLDS